jgi:hypothetical protein
VRVQLAPERLDQPLEGGFVARAGGGEEAVGGSPRGSGLAVVLELRGRDADPLHALEASSSASVPLQKKRG